MIYHCMMPPCSDPVSTPVLHRYLPACRNIEAVGFKKPPLYPTFETYFVWPSKNPKKKWVKDGQSTSIADGVLSHGIPQRILMGDKWSAKGPLWYHWFPGFRPPPGKGFPPELKGKDPTGMSNLEYRFLWGKSIEVGKIHGNLLGKKNIKTPFFLEQKDICCARKSTKPRFMG